MRWLIAGSLGTPDSVSVCLPSTTFWREMRVQKPRPGTGAPYHQVGLGSNPNLVSILQSPDPSFPLLLLITSIWSNDKHLFLDQELDPTAGQASSFPHFLANLCLNLDLTPLLSACIVSPTLRAKLNNFASNGMYLPLRASRESHHRPPPDEAGGTAGEACSFSEKWVQANQPSG